MSKTHELGWLKRVDRGNGLTDFVDGWNKPVVTMATKDTPQDWPDLKLKRCRMTFHDTE